MTEERLTGDRHCIRCHGFLPKGSIINSADGTRVLEFSGAKGDPKAGWFHSKPSCRDLECTSPGPAPVKARPAPQTAPPAALPAGKGQDSAPAAPKAPGPVPDIPSGVRQRPRYVQVAGWVRIEDAPSILAAFAEVWAGETEVRA